MNWLMHIPMIAGALIGMGLMLLILAATVVAFFWGDKE